MSRLFLVFLLGSLWTTILAADEPVIHVVIATGAGMERDVDSRNIEKAFRQGIPKARLNLVLTDPRTTTPDAILETIGKLQPSRNDTLVFYFSGPSARNDRSGGHSFQLKNGTGQASELQRRTLLARMKEKQTRLCVLLTDSCTITPGAVAEKNAATESPDRIAPLFQALLVRPAGVVDITSSKRGEASLTDTTDRKRGSCFTYPLVELLEKHRNQDVVTWTAFVDELRREVQKAFRESWPNGYRFEENDMSVVQTTQTVEVYGSLPGANVEGAVPEGPRFGVRAANHQGPGVRITEVLKNSPGGRAGFEVGDVIIEINGQKVANEQDYSDLIDASPKQCEIKLINVNDRQTILVKFELRN